MKKALQIIFDIAFYGIFSIMLLCIILSVFGIKLYNVPTGSMEPNIHANSLVMVNNNANYDDIEVGDVIIYERQSDDIMIIHRVIEKTDNGLYTKGDANAIADGICITPDIFVGKFIFAIPKIGKFFDWLESPVNKVIYLASMIGLSAIDILLTDKKGKRSKRKEEL